MEWYLSLNINQKINLKKMAKPITGLLWAEMSVFFTLRERVEIIYNKLVLEGLLRG